MSTKKRDLAQELVDFLIKEDGQKKNQPARKFEKENQSGNLRPLHPAMANSSEHDHDDTKPIALEEVTSAASSQEQKTIALIENSLVRVIDKVDKVDKVDNAVYEFSAPLPSSDSNTKRLKILDEIEPAPEAGEPIVLGEVSVQSVMTAPTELKVAANTSPQGFASQRANVVFNDVSALMAGTEAVKVAQARITTLEKDNDALRTETEQLLSASESLQRRLNELRAQHENLERKHREKIEILEDEKAVLRTRLNAKEDEIGRLRKENEDLKARFQTDLRKIRVRERELEHRQEIMKAEMTTVVHSKDEVIIDLKRSLEKLNFELDNLRAKASEMNARISEFHERNHRTVKALRLALSVLETGDSEDKPKKAG